VNLKNSFIVLAVIGVAIVIFALGVPLLLPHVIAVSTDMEISYDGFGYPKAGRYSFEGLLIEHPQMTVKAKTAALSPLFDLRPMKYGISAQMKNIAFDQPGKPLGSWRIEWADIYLKRNFQGETTDMTIKGEFIPARLKGLPESWAEKVGSLNDTAEFVIVYENHGYTLYVRGKPILRSTWRW